MTTTTDNAKGALIDSLNGLLADSFALYIKTKNFHWHVSGPQFRDLHLLFDEHGPPYSLVKANAPRAAPTAAPPAVTAGGR